MDAASWEKVLTLVKAHTKDINKGTKESQNFLVQKIVEIVGREKWDQVFSSGERPSGVKSLDAPALDPEEVAMVQRAEELMHIVQQHHDVIHGVGQYGHSSVRAQDIKPFDSSSLHAAQATAPVAQQHPPVVTPQSMLLVPHRQHVQPQQQLPKQVLPQQHHRRIQQQPVQQPQQLPSHTSLNAPSSQLQPVESAKTQASPLTSNQKDNLLKGLKELVGTNLWSSVVEKVQQHSAHRLRLQDILAEIQLQVTPELWQKIKEKINSFREAKRTTGGAAEPHPKRQALANSTGAMGLKAGQSIADFYQ